MKKYFSLFEQPEQKVTDIYIYGDITSWEWLESDMSSYTLSKAIQGIETEDINVYINSYGGDVAEGLAIYSSLKRHKGKVTTYCDGFACSAASVVFAAGDERVMGNASLLMIHNAWTRVEGDSEALKKQAQDLETITQASINAYKQVSNLGETELKEMMNAETWILPEDAVSMGFATSVSKEQQSNNPTQSVRGLILQQFVPKQEDTKDANENILQTVKEVLGDFKTEILETIKQSQPTEQEPEENVLQKFFNKL